MPSETTKPEGEIIHIHSRLFVKQMRPGDPASYSVRGGDVFPVWGSNLTREQALAKVEEMERSRAWFQGHAVEVHEDDRPGHRRIRDAHRS